jgi:hypothetical protein
MDCFAALAMTTNTTRFHSLSKGLHMDFVAELWRFMRVRKKFWLLPILVMMVVFGGLVVLTKGSAIAPFIYTLF